MATVLNVTEILKRSDGSEVRISGDAKFYAQSNYANLLLIDVEDGGSLQANALINFTQQTRQSFTSHDFFVKPVGIVTRVVNEEIITAYQYAIQVPKLVLQNNTKEVIESKLTFKIASGTNYRGYYTTLSALNTALPPTEELETDKAVAYVVQTEEFYQVLYNSTSEAYEWTTVEYIDMLLVTKQYSLSSIYIQGGFSSPQGIAPISASNTQVIMSILNDLQVLYNSLNNNYTTLSELVDDIVDGTQQIAFDKTGTNLNSDFVDDAIKEVNDKANANEQNIIDMKDGTDAFSEILLGTPPNTVTIRYIHTNGNNYQVVSITYPDGREANVDEELYINFRNESGGTRDSGIFLMTDGLSLGNQAVKGVLFNPTSQHARKFLGVTTVEGVAVNQKSKVTRFGIVHGIPTTRFRTTGTAYTEGQYLWGTADGLLSNVVPTKPALQVNVGIIINLVGGNADILVCPIVYGAFGDSSDVIITTPTNGDIPVLGSDGVWRNSQRLVTAESEITKIKDGTTIVKKAEQDKNGNDIVNTYETKSTVSGINGRVTSLENANMIKSYTYNTSTHVLTFTYFDGSTTSLDLPLESAIVDASYDNATKDITFTLQSGATLVVPLDDLVSGLASETWVNTYFIPKTALKTSFSATPLDTNVISEKLAKDQLDLKENLSNKKSVINDSEIEYPSSGAILKMWLDVPIKALNNNTLRNVFITSNKFVNNLSNWLVLNGVNKVLDDGYVKAESNNTSITIYQNISVTNHKYYMRGDLYNGALNGYHAVRAGSLYTLKSTIYQYNEVSNLITYNETGTRVFGFLWNSILSGQTFGVKNQLLIDTTDLEIDALSVEELNYWYRVFSVVYNNNYDNVFSSINSNSNNLYGKKVVFLGDSITEKNTRSLKNYWEYVTDDIGIEPYNMGLAGSGFMRKQDTSQAYYQRVLTAPNNADLYILVGSGNDLYHIANIGTATDTGTTTIGGCINQTITNLLTVNPLAKIMIASPTAWEQYMPSVSNNYMEQYTQLLKEIALLNGVYFLDVYHMSGLRPNVEAFRLAYFSRDDGNGVHPDENGHKWFYPLYREAIKNVLALSNH